MSMVYVCYDLKGIQKLIFQIPKLKCSIGGSRQLDHFDREDVEQALNIKGVTKIFSGGGKGAFQCADATSATELEKALTKLAWEKGLTIHFGISENYSEAASSIKSMYSYLPSQLDGHPCSLSGQYPVSGGGDSVHPLIAERLKAGTHANDLEQGLLRDLQQKLESQTDFRCENGLEFFANVDASDIDGYEGAVVLGKRNRWAVICMDGNDMGEQFRTVKENMQANPAADGMAATAEQLRKMSEKLSACTREAVLEGMLAICKQYFADCADKASGEEFVSSRQSQARILPIRPLIIGGDDVTILTHCSYAMLFARKVIETFNHISKCFDCCQFWRSTGGQLSISAGILYAPVNLPLSSAISYAETLLASAKSKGRRLRANAKGQPSPACLDWESVTDGLLDSVHDRRQRELLFFDKACNRTIELTKRPYTMEELDGLEKLCDKLEGIPASIRYEVLPSLRATLDDRLAYYARIRKNHPELAACLQEPWQENGGKYGADWTIEEGDRQTTDVIDALLCLEEESRMSKEKQTV